jgi:hypothetical protein
MIFGSFLSIFFFFAGAVSVESGGESVSEEEKVREKKVERGGR